MQDDIAELKGQVSQYVDVPGIRALNKVWLVKRGGIRADWTNAPHKFVSTFVHAGSSLTANLKGGGIEDGPLQRRELHPDLSIGIGTGIDDKYTSGIGLITSDTDFGGSAPPDVIMTDLEMYTRSIMKSREKDQVYMGAKRIGDLWKGHIFEQEGKRRFGGVFRSGTIPEGGTDEDTDDGGKSMGPIARTGQAIKGLVGYVSSEPSQGVEVEMADLGVVANHQWQRRVILIMLAVAGVDSGIISTRSNERQQLSLQ